MTCVCKTKAGKAIPCPNHIERLWEWLMIWGARMGCHQMPERSFFWHGRQFPVCARCTGVAVASILLLPMFLACHISASVAILLCLVMLVDWGLQYLGILESNNVRRLITGYCGGLGVGVLELRVFVWLLSHIIQKLK